MKQQKKQRRNVDDVQQNTTHQELKRSIINIKNKRNRALASFLYLTGCRISEVVGKTKIIPIYTGTMRDNNKIKVTDKKVQVAALTTDNIIYKGDDFIIVQNVPCLKHRNNVPRRNIPIRISSDSALAITFLDYWTKLPEGVPLFPLTRQRAWQIINKELGIYTHYLIHQRCTELVSDREFTELHLKQFRGWHDTRPASIYAHLNYQDLARKM